ncbi:unnamed protein product [Polarella glacialis]|uniref:Uncharacterized protein n=1 Tax=Polarella glacialis TaxID=89957 RepID=A0A813LUL0_POLGL|nr:unnamed protein product [Polarella glacialis]
MSSPAATPAAIASPWISPAMSSPAVTPAAITSPGLQSNHTAATPPAASATLIHHATASASAVEKWPATVAPGLGDQKFHFGKFRGLSFKDVSMTHPQYCVWALGKKAGGGLADFVRFLKSQQPQLEPEHQIDESQLQPQPLLMPQMQELQPEAHEHLYPQRLDHPLPQQHQHLQECQQPGQHHFNEANQRSQQQLQYQQHPENHHQQQSQYQHHQPPSHNQHQQKPPQQPQLPQQPGQEQLHSGQQSPPCHPRQCYQYHNQPTHPQQLGSHARHHDQHEHQQHNMHTQHQQQHWNQGFSHQQMMPQVQDQVVLQQPQAFQHPPAPRQSLQQHPQTPTQLVQPETQQGLVQGRPMPSPLRQASGVDAPSFPQSLGALKRPALEPRYKDIRNFIVKRRYEPIQS